LTGLSNRVSQEDRMKGDEDQKFVSACQKGNLNAFEALVEKYQKKMLNIAYRIIGDYEEACEVVQDAFVSAYKAIGKFRGEAKFSTWMHTIVVNHSKNRLQQLRTRFHREGPSIDDPLENEEGSSPREFPSPNPSAAEELERKEIHATVQGCIESLELEFREVLVLRDIQGLSYDEIRDILKIPDGTVKSRLFRARDAVKDCLERKLGDL